MGVRRVTVVENILNANDEIALENRRRFDEAGVLVLDIMASPGAGKTSLIMRTIAGLEGEMKAGVIEGDIASQVDADKVAAAGTPVVQINTGGGCHLDANMVRAAMAELPLEQLDLLLIENVGNLVCPAAFRLGEQLQIVVASFPEGDDKPIKYPALFAQADAVVINKADLEPYVDFNRAAFRDAVLGLNPRVALFELSCRTGSGVSEWLEWLRRRRSEFRGQRPK